MLNPRLLALPLTLLLFGFTDAESGLVIDPPGDFIAVPLPPRDGGLAGLLVGVFRYDADLNNIAPPFCVVGLSNVLDNSERTQTELNNRMRDPGRLANMVATFNAVYTILSDEPVELAGVFGHQFIVEDKTATGDHADLLQVNSSFDTPKGRVTINCGTAREDLTANLVTFGLIRESITLP